jgi:ketosteroid isomerase-like protein
MSQANVEALRAVYDEWANGNFRAGVDLYDPEVVFVQGPGFPESGAHHGREGIREFMRTFLETCARLTLQARAFLEAEETVVVEVIQRGSGKESAAPGEFRYFHVWSFRGRKVIRLDVIRNREDALEAAGLSELAMSRENVSMVRRVNDLFNAKEVEQALDLVGDDFEMDWTNSIGPLKGVYRGRQGVLELWTSFLDAWESVRWDPEQIIEVDETQLVVLNHVRMRGRGSGVQVDASAAQLWTITNGTARRIKLFQSKADALEAARLRE